MVDWESVAGAYPIYLDRAEVRGLRPMTGSLEAQPSKRPRRRRRRVATLEVAAVLGLLSLLAVTACTGVRPKAALSVVTIAAATETEAVTAGNPLQFLIRAEPPPPADLTIGVTIAPVDCELQLPPAPESATIAGGDSEATLTVQTTGVVIAADGCTVQATIEPGEGYEVDDTGTSASIPLTRPGPVAPPVVTIGADSGSVVEGSQVSFTLTANPPPAAPLEVGVSWSDSGSFLTGTRPPMVTIPTSGMTTLSAATEDDTNVESNGTVTVTVHGGSDYTIGTADSASITVTDNDASPTTTGPRPVGTPVVTIAATHSSVVESNSVSFTLTATPPPAAPLPVDVNLSESGSFLSVTGRRTITIPTSEMTTLSAATEDNTDIESHGTVTATVQSGSGYTVGTPNSASVSVTDNDRTLTISGPGTVTWGPAVGPFNDGTTTRLNLNNTTQTSTYILKVRRGSAASCVMLIDPTYMPGTPEVPAGQVRMTTPTSDTFTNYGTSQSLTFDEGNYSAGMADVRQGGTIGLPAKTLVNASMTLPPFLRMVEM